MLLHGQRILIVENEFFGAMDLAEMIHDAGAHVVGQATSACKALQLLSEETITAAILGVNLDVSLDIALKLKRLHIPFVYLKSPNSSVDLSAWPEAPVVHEPACETSLIDLLVEAINLEAATPFTGVLN